MYNKLELAEIPKRYWDKNWSDFETNSETLPRVRLLMDLCNNIKMCSGEIIYLWGSNNTGKTLLSCIMLQSLFLKDLDCSFHFFTPTSLVDLYTARWRDHTKELDAFRSREYVVLDDAFDPRKEYEGSSGGIVVPTVDDFLRYRYHNNLLTIVTANMPLEKLVQSSQWRHTAQLLMRGDQKYRIRLTGGMK